MRILQVISGIEPENGGPTAALIGHCRALLTVGIQPAIVATWKYESSFKLAEELRAEGIAVTLLGPTKRPFRTHADMDRVLTDAIAASDVVHIHAVWEWIEHRAAAVSRRLGKPYVWTPHGMLDEWNMRRNHWFKRACLAAYLRKDLKNAAAIHVASEFEKRQVGRLKLGVPNLISGFGLDVTVLNYAAPRGAFRQSLGLSEDTPLVLFLGRIQRGKGLEILVPALAASRHKNAALVIAGPDEGDHRREIEALIARHGVTARVTFVGMIGGERKLQALADADVLAAPSAHENFGIAVAEAIAIGTPVAVSDQVGLGDAILAHDLGRVAPLTVPATAAAIDDLLDSPIDARHQRHERCRRYAAEHFDWLTIAHGWQHAYGSLLTKTPASLR